jgi:acyl-CoA dehydrogenase
MNHEPVSRLDEDDVRSLREVTSRICGDLLEESLTAPEVGLPFLPKLWEALEDAGLLRAGLGSHPADGGTGWEVAAIVLAEAGRRAAPGPFMETSFLSEWLLEEAGLPPIASGPVTTGRGSFTLVADGRVRVSADRVPWARAAEHVIAVGTLDDDAVVAVLDPRSAEIEDHRNVAFQPRESVVAVIGADAVHRVDPGLLDQWLLRGALGRSIQTCGALDRAVELTIDHVRTRRQFGRPLAAFQAVQQLLAAAAGELAVATSAADVAVTEALSLDFTLDATVLAVAAAKSQSSRAATVVARSCHQLHGAIGMTLDHPLRHFTMSALAWRNEFGSQSYWDDRIGRLATADDRGAWELLTALAN